MPGHLNVVAIIPARGGSRGLPRKNIRLLAGKPLISYTIEAAKTSAMVDRTLVSTDDAEIAEVARHWGAEVPFLRPGELAQDHTPTEPVLQHAVEWLEQTDHYRVDIIVYLQPTDIFRKRAMIDTAVQRLLDDPELDTAFVAYATHKNFWRQVDGQFLRLAPDIKPGPRQTREPVYREDTGLACASRAAVIKSGRRIGDRVAVIPTDDDLSSIDIHTEFDLWLAEQVLTEGGREVND